jgi:hypothetical protein
MSQVQISQMTQSGKYLFVGPNQELPPEAESEGYIINHSPMNNWVQTKPDEAWFPYFRLYSPTQAFLDQTWVLPDIEKADDK